MHLYLLFIYYHGLHSKHCGQHFAECASSMLWSLLNNIPCQTVHSLAMIQFTVICFCSALLSSVLMAVFQKHVSSSMQTLGFLNENLKLWISFHVIAHLPYIVLNYSSHDSAFSLVVVQIMEEIKGKQKYYYVQLGFILSSINYKKEEEFLRMMYQSFVHTNINILSEGNEIRNYTDMNKRVPQAIFQFQHL